MADNLKSGFVAIIGKSNVGKSTLMNYIIGYKIAIVADKLQTTRGRIQTVYTEDRGQIVFQDTPGVHLPKNELSKKMMSAVVKCINDADVLLWLVEPNAYIGDREKDIANLIKNTKKPVILAVNKCDKLQNSGALPIIDVYRKLYDFDEILPISAKNGTNINELLSFIFKYLPYGDKFYDDDTLTDQPIRHIVSELIREKALRLLDKEIPHGIAVYIEKMYNTKKDTLTNIEATIVCEKDSHKGIVIGKGGSMLKKIGSLARADIEELVGNQVNLKLFVKVRKDWRDNNTHIRNFELFMD